MVYCLLRSEWCVWLINLYIKIIIKEPSQEIILYWAVIDIYAKYSESSHSLYARKQYRAGARHLNWICLPFGLWLPSCLNSMSSNNCVSVGCWCWCFGSLLGSAQHKNGFFALKNQLNKSSHTQSNHKHQFFREWSYACFRLPS